MSALNTDTIIQNIIRDLNITSRSIPTHSITVSQAKQALESITNGLDFFMSKNEALCKHFNLNYKNIQKNNISIFDLIVEKYTNSTEENILLSIDSLKDYYFYTSRGCEYTRGESLLVPLIEYYYNKYEDKSTFLNINGTESLGYVIYEFDDFKIMTGKGCCNHRLYGIVKAFNILKDSKVLIRELITTKVTFKKLSIYNYITQNLLIKLSNEEFIITKLKINEIEIVSNKIAYYWSLNYSSTPCLENQVIVNFLENLKFHDMISARFNIKNVFFFEHQNGNIEIKFYSLNEKSIKLLLDKSNIDTLYDINKITDYNLTKLIKFSIHYFLGFYMINKKEFFFKDIDNKEERTYYLNRALESLI